MALILSLNDGYSTYLSGKPMTHFWDKIYNRRAPDAVTGINILNTAEKGMDMKSLRLNRAGQLSFQPGEQIHCGVGSRGHICEQQSTLVELLCYCSCASKKI